MNTLVRFECPFCHLQFETKKELDKHIRAEHTVRVGGRDLKGDIGGAGLDKRSKF